MTTTGSSSAERFKRAQEDLVELRNLETEVMKLSNKQVLKIREDKTLIISDSPVLHLVNSLCHTRYLHGMRYHIFNRMVKFLKEAGYDLDQTTTCLCGRDDTALTCAVFIGNRALVKALLENGANPETRSGQGKLPLYYALFGEKDPKILEMLIQAGARSNQLTEPPFETLIWTFSDTDTSILAYLLARDLIDPNSGHVTSGNHVMMNEEELEKLSFGDTPLYRALQMLNLKVLRTLLERPSLRINFGPEGGDEAIHLIEHLSRKEDLEVMEWLVNSGVDASNYKFQVPYPHLGCLSIYQMLYRIGVSFGDEFFNELEIRRSADAEERKLMMKEADDLKTWKDVFDKKTDNRRCLLWLTCVNIRKVARNVGEFKGMVKELPDELKDLVLGKYTNKFG